MSADLIKIAENNGYELDHLSYGGPIFQVKGLYTFTSDSICLAKFVEEENINTLVDFCSGSGIVGLEVAGRIKTNNLFMFEIQEELYNACSLTASLNTKLGHLVPVFDMVQNAKNYCKDVDCIVCNPPYFKKGSGELSSNNSKNLARHEIALTIEEIFVSASEILKNKGSFYLVHIFSRDKEILKLAKKYGFKIVKEKVMDGKLSRKLYKFILEK